MSVGVTVYVCWSVCWSDCLCLLVSVVLRRMLPHLGQNVENNRKNEEI